MRQIRRVRHCSPTLSRSCLLAAWVLSFGYSTLAPASHAQTNEQSPLGINVSPISYWSTEIPTVDFFKRASRGSADGLWLTQCDNCNQWDTNEEGTLDLDAQGWPRSLPSAGANVLYRYVTTNVVLEMNRYPAGRYTVFYDGEGQLSYGMDATLNAALSGPGRDILDIVPNSGFTVSIRATDPRHTGNYLRNIHIIPPGGTCNNDPFSYAADASACPASFRAFTDTYQTQPFHPRFLSNLRPFSAIRFMNFQGTVTSQVQEWNERTPFDYASWSASYNKGAPVEVAIDMANALNASPWLNVPALASNDYITQFARLVKSRLKTSRPIYLEYHNEIWNLADPYNIIGRIIARRGQGLWPAAACSASESLANDTCLMPQRLNYYGMRTADVCRIWKQEFGARAAQVKCVMGAWNDFPSVSETVLSCPLYAGQSGHNCAAQMDALAVAPYFGIYLTEPPYQAIVTSWISQPDGGVGNLFTELNTGLMPRTDSGQTMGAIAQTLNYVAANQAIAQKYGLPLVAYEGGQHLGAPYTADYTATLRTLFERANRDPRMGQAYQQYLTGWKQAGGGLLALLGSTEAYSAAGQFGMLEYQDQTRAQSPKYDAMLNFINANNCWWAVCSQTASTNCLFNWAERSYPQLFSPAGAISGNYAAYYYRYYSGTANYLAISSTDNHIWMLGPGTGNALFDVGPIANFLGTAGCI